MKKLTLLTAIMAVISLSAFAQDKADKHMDKKGKHHEHMAVAEKATQKGTWLLGGSAYYNHSTQDYSSGTGSTKVNTFAIAPNLGYFFGNRFMGGVMLNYSHSSTDNTGSTYTNSSFLGGPWLRYYFASLCDEDMLFGEGTFLFGSNKYENSGQSSTYNATQWQLGIGNAWFLNKSIAFEQGIFYNQYQQKAQSGGTEPKPENSFGVKLGFQIHFGYQDDYQHVMDKEKKEKRKQMGFAEEATQKGTWLLGGYAGYMHTSQDDQSGTGSTKTNTFSIGPDAGYFFGRHFMGGVMTDYSHTTTSNGSNSSTYSTFMGGPWVRYYFVPLCERDMLFGDANFQFGSSKYESGGQSSTANATQWQVGVGNAFFLNRSIALEQMFYYNQYQQKAQGGGTEPKPEDNFGFKVGFQIHFNHNHAEWHEQKK